jgi:cytochrome c biogenesis protein CcdA
MTLTLIFSMLGIAIVDSLNPSLFIAQFYLITTPKPIPRLISYVSGVLVVNFIAGILLLAGVRTLLTDFFNGLSPTTVSIGQLILGGLCVGFGLWLKTTPAEAAEARKPHSLRPIHTFLLGMAVMLNEMSTALPYFVAIERLGSAGLGTIENLGMIVFYNLIFSLPLFGFIGAFVALRERFVRQLGAVSEWIRKWTPRLMKFGSLIFGLILIVVGLTELITAR